MKQPLPQTIHRILGSNNILLVVTDGYNAPANEQEGNFVANLALTLAAQLNCYAVVNTKYKREIMDLSDIVAIQARPAISPSLLSRIRAAVEDQHLKTAVASTDAPYCGRDELGR